MIKKLQRYIRLEEETRKRDAMHVPNSTKVYYIENGNKNQNRNVKPAMMIAKRRRFASVIIVRKRDTMLKYACPPRGLNYLTTRGIW